MSASHSHLSHPKYRPDIDGLRALAVLAVVGFHAFPSWIRGGFVGVDVFFVISGFLISTIIFENLDRGTFSFREFYARRIKRIFPALLLVLFASYAFGWFALLADEYKQLGKHIAAGAGFVSNFALWHEAGYFDNTADTKPLLHLWSLGIEEQFYIVWPFVLWCAWKRKANLLTVTILVAAVSFYLNLKGVKKDSVAAFYSPPTRFWELLSGSMLAWCALYKKGAFTSTNLKLDALLCSMIYREKLSDDGRTLSNVLSFLGVILLAVGFWRINKETGFPGKWALLPISGAVLIIIAGPKAWFNRTILSSKIAVWFGLISFPLYLWHWPILSFARIVESGLPSREIRLAAVVVSIALAWFTYKFVERPIRLSESSNKKVAVLSMLMVVCGLVGYLTFKENGFEWRERRFQSFGYSDLIKPYPHIPFHNDSCDSMFPGFKEYGACLISKNISPEILILGDSHSQQYFKSFSRKLPDMSVMNLAHGGCLPFSSVTHLTPEDCDVKFSAALRFAAETPSIKAIYLVGYWGYLASGGFGIDNENYRLPRRLTDKDASAFFDKGSKFLSVLVSSGKEIIFVGDTPDLDFNIRSCFDSRPLVFGHKNVREFCGVTRAEFDGRNRDYHELISKLVSRFPSVKSYNPTDLFCDGVMCKAVIKEKPLYYNSDHLTIYGADLVIDDLLSKYPINRP